METSYVNVSAWCIHRRSRGCDSNVYSKMACGGDYGTFRCVAGHTSHSGGCHSVLWCLLHVAVGASARINNNVTVKASIAANNEEVVWGAGTAIGW